MSDQDSNHEEGEVLPPQVAKAQAVRHGFEVVELNAETIDTLVNVLKINTPSKVLAISRRLCDRMEELHSETIGPAEVSRILIFQAWLQEQRLGTGIPTTLEDMQNRFSELEYIRVASKMSNIEGNPHDDTYTPYERHKYGPEARAIQYHRYPKIEANDWWEFRTLFIPLAASQGFTTLLHITKDNEKDHKQKYTNEDEYRRKSNELYTILAHSMRSNYRSTQILREHIEDPDGALVWMKIKAALDSEGNKRAYVGKQLHKLRRLKFTDEQFRRNPNDAFEKFLTEFEGIIMRIEDANERNEPDDQKRIWLEDSVAEFRDFAFSISGRRFDNADYKTLVDELRHTNQYLVRIRENRKEQREQYATSRAQGSITRTSTDNGGRSQYFQKQKKLPKTAFEGKQGPLYKGNNDRFNRGANHASQWQSQSVS